MLKLSLFLALQNEHLLCVLTPQMQSDAEIRIPANQGIAGHVNTTGQLLNIDDAYSHPLFYRGVDDSTGFRTRFVALKTMFLERPFCRNFVLSIVSTMNHKFLESEPNYPTFHMFIHSVNARPNVCAWGGVSKIGSDTECLKHRCYLY